MSSKIYSFATDDPKAKNNALKKINSLGALATATNSLCGEVEEWGGGRLYEKKKPMSGPYTRGSETTEIRWECRHTWNCKRCIHLPCLARSGGNRRGDSRKDIFGLWGKGRGAKKHSSCGPVQFHKNGWLLENSRLCATASCDPTSRQKRETKLSGGWVTAYIT